MLVGFSSYRSREAEGLDCRNVPSSGSFAVLHKGSGLRLHLVCVNSHGVGLVLSLVRFL